VEEIRTLAEKYDAHNHATGVYKHNLWKQPFSYATSIPAPKKKQQQQDNSQDLDSSSSSRSLMKNTVRLRRIGGRKKDFICTVEYQGIMQIPVGR
jgi:hypothetical protein